MIRRKLLNSILAAGALLACQAIQSFAEVTQVTLARHPGDSYLSLMLMEHYHLVEKHAKALGLDNINVKWIVISGGAVANDMLLSGQSDFVTGGVGPMLKIWSATNGTVKGVAALNAVPLLLNTNDPSIKSLRDFNDTHKIAVPSVGVSMQAVILKMAAAKEFGDPGKLDKLTVSMQQADSTVALLSGGGQLTATFANSPFQYQQLEDPKVHTVLSSYDVLGGPATFGVFWTTDKFRTENPRIYRSVVAAHKEATALINKDKLAAAKMYIKLAKSKLSESFMERILTSPEYQYNVTPLNTLALAVFMHRIGQVKLSPKSWKDYFFPEIHELPGS